MSSEVHASEAQLSAEDDWDTAGKQERTRTVGLECGELEGIVKGRRKEGQRGQKYSRDRGAARVKEKQRKRHGRRRGASVVL